MKTLYIILLAVGLSLFAEASRACDEGFVACGSVCCSGNCCNGGPCDDPRFPYYCPSPYVCTHIDGPKGCVEPEGSSTLAPKAFAQRSEVDDDAPRSCALGHAGGTVGSLGLLVATVALALARRRRGFGAPRR